MGRGKAYFWHACQIEEVHMYSDLPFFFLTWHYVGKPIWLLTSRMNFVLASQSLQESLSQQKGCTSFWFVSSTSCLSTELQFLVIIQASPQSAREQIGLLHVLAPVPCEGVITPTKVPPDTSVSFNFKLTLLGWGERVKILLGSKVMTSRNLRVNANF